MLVLTFLIVLSVSGRCIWHGHIILTAGDAAVTNFTISSPGLQARPFESDATVGPPISRDQPTAQIRLSVLVPPSQVLADGSTQLWRKS